MPVVFWTDALIYLLLAALGAGIFFSARTPHLRRPWQKVTRSRVAMVSLVILACYTLIGVLDSIHYFPKLEQTRPGEPTVYANEAISLLDYGLTPLRERIETTYSAPFAAHSYAREMLTGDEGQQYWGYPRLTYGGSHLTDPESERALDILVTGLSGLAVGGIAWLLLTQLTILLLAAHRKQRLYATACYLFGTTRHIPWRWVLATAFVIIVTLTVLLQLSLKYHVLGTDKVGQDVFYQALKSIRTGLAIGTLTTLVMLPFALVLGILAGFCRGWVDDVVQYLYTTLNSIPGVLLIAASILMMQVYMANHEESFASLAIRADIRLLFLCMILGVTSWTGLCRLLRAETLKLREMDYVQAAVAMGVTRATIMLRHILPNVFHIVLITIVLDFSGLVLAEAVLSYVDIGVDPTMNSWGNMINVARLELARDPVVWWSLCAALIFMFTLVLAANLFADTVRDAFDPRRV